MDATTLADFDLLRDSREDIRQQPWTQPSRREAMNLYFGIKRAKEEISRLNIEIRRLVTFMIDDHHDFHRAIRANIIINPALGRELSYQWEYRHQIHSQIASRLRQTSRLNGFTGTLWPGTREGRELVYTEGGLPKWATDVFGFVEGYEEVDEIEIEGEEETEHDEALPNSDLVLELLKNIDLHDTLDSRVS